MGRLANEALEHLLSENEKLQFALDSYSGQISIHHPTHKLFNSAFHLVPKERQSWKPLKALTVFTDTCGASHKSVMVRNALHTQQWETDVKKIEGSPQVAELATVIRAFEKFSVPFNLVMDLAYVAAVISRTEKKSQTQLSLTWLPPGATMLHDACQITHWPSQVYHQM